MSSGRAQTTSDYSSTFCVITWVLQVGTVLMVTMKLGMAHATIGIRPDDWSIFIAIIASIGNTVAVSFAGTNGLGREQSTLTPAQMDVFEKSTYAGMILYITSIAASKISIVLFSYMLTYKASHRLIAASVGAFILAWAVGSIFATAFQCTSPHMWSILNGSCYAIIPFWTSFAVINVLTEIAMIVLPVMIIFPTRFNSWRKVVLIFCFSLRILVIAAGIVQIYYLHSSMTYNPMKSRTNFTLYSWTYTLTSEILQCLSITTVCIPFVKPMLMALQSGMFQTGKLGLDTMRSIADTEKASSTRKEKRTRVGGLEANVKMSETSESKMSDARPSDSQSRTLTPISSRNNSGPPYLSDSSDEKRPLEGDGHRDSMNSMQLLNEWGMGKWFL